MEDTGNSNSASNNEQNQKCRKYGIVGAIVLIIAIIIAIVVPLTVGGDSGGNTKGSDEQLLVACTFFNIPNLDICRATTIAGSFSGNEFPRGVSIPTEIGLMTGLTRVFMNNRDLFGTIPSEMGNLIQLDQLTMTTNQLTGSIPSTLGNLSRLTWLHIHRNRLVGTIPSTLGNLVRLRELFLQQNQFTGTIPSTIGNLMQIERLLLTNNTDLGGAVPSSLCSSFNGFVRISIECENIECFCCVNIGGANCTMG